MGIESKYGKSNLPGLLRLRVLDLSKVKDFSEPEFFKDLGVAAHTLTSAAITLKDEVIAMNDPGWEDIWFLGGENNYQESLEPNGNWLTTLAVNPANDSASTRAWVESAKKKRWLLNAMDADGKYRMIGTSAWPVKITGIGFDVSGYKGRVIQFSCLSARQPYFCTSFWDHEIETENSDFSEEFGFDFG